MAVLNDMTGYVLLGDVLKLDARRVWFISTAQLVRGDYPVRELDSGERDRVLARFFGVSLVDDDTDAGAAQEEPDTESELDVDPEPTPEEPTLAPNLDVTLDPSDTSQAGFDEFV